MQTYEQKYNFKKSLKVMIIKIKDILEEDFGIHSKVRFQDIRLSNNRKRVNYMDN